LYTQRAVVFAGIVGMRQGRQAGLLPAHLQL
jgi:hypothetical protein